MTGFSDPDASQGHSIYELRGREERAPSSHGPRRTRRVRRTLGRRVTLGVTVLAFCYAAGTVAWLAVRKGWLSHLWELRSETADPVDTPRPVEAERDSEARLLSLIDRLQNREVRNREIVLETGRLTARGLVGEAAALLRRELAEAPKSLVLLEEMAAVDLAAGRAAAARDGFLDVLSYAPDRLSAREGLADACMRLGHFSAALATAQWLLRDDPDRLAALRIAARVSVEVGQYPAATRHLKRWLDKEPGSVEARDLIGLCYLRLGEYGKAGFYLQKLARDGEGTEATFLNLALVFAQQKQSGDVIAVLGEAAQRFSVKTVVQWFGRADFAGLHGDQRIVEFVTHLINASSPALSLRLPQRSSEIVTEPMMGITPRPDIIMTP